MAKIALRCDGFLAIPQPPIRGHDGWHAPDDAGSGVGSQRDRSRRSAQSVHRIQPRLRALTEQRLSRRRQHTRGRQLGTKCLELRRRGQIPMPQQPRRLFERGVLGQLPHRVPGDDELAPFAIDVTEAG
jgi:hypothetical protein